MRWVAGGFLIAVVIGGAVARAVVDTTAGAVVSLALVFVAAYAFADNLSRHYHNQWQAKMTTTPAADRVDAVTFPTTLHGWRLWVIAGDGSLTSPQRNVPWPDGGRWLTAACLASRHHEAPQTDCRCGLYILADPGVAVRRGTGAAPSANGTFVLGVMQGSGRAVRQDDGWRIARGRPKLLILPNNTGDVDDAVVAAITAAADRYQIPAVPGDAYTESLLDA